MLIPLYTETGPIDLADIRPCDVPPGFIARRLSRIARFNGGGMSAHPLSVAQHCCIGHDYLMRMSPMMALWFLFHDAHEAVIGDIPTPVAQLFDLEFVTRGDGGTVFGFSDAKAAIAERIDAAAHEAAGLPWPVSAADTIKDVDAACCRAEALYLYGPAAHEWFPPVINGPARGGIDVRIEFGPKFKVWPPAKAEEEFNRRAARKARIAA